SIEARTCVRAAEVADGLCRIHSDQIARLELHDRCLVAHRLRSCVMPRQNPRYRVPEGTTLLCGNPARHDVAGAPFCDEHYAPIAAWRDTRVDEIAGVDPDWMLGWEATGRQII